MVKRMLLALGAGFGIALVDVWLSSATVSNAWDLDGPMFWYVFLNRAAIGFFVAIVGIVTIHPLLNFKMFPIRGAFVGIWVSLSLAASVFFDDTATWGLFWMVILSGAIYGVAIDVFATKFSGQGKQLLHPENE
tara:strand:- start:19082 stop:19483 length:402 start_codon:yes stop_codon:yes gene_type:complete